MSQRKRPPKQGKSRIQHSIEPVPSSVDWKNSPVMIACGAATGMLLLCIGVFTQLVLPTQTAKLDVEIIKLKSELESKDRSLIDASEKLRESSKELRSGEKQIRKLRADLLHALNNDLFPPGVPYPNGVDKVRVGMSASKLQEFYPASAIRKNPNSDGILNVELKDSPFESVVYFFDETSSEKAISHIYFRLDPFKNYPEDFLWQKLTNSLGEPQFRPKRNYIAWKTPSGGVFSSDDGSFIVMQPGLRPSYWPDE